MNKVSVVVAAIDLFKGSSMVLRRAIDQTKPVDGTLHVIHVAEPNMANVSPSAVDAPDLTGFDPAKLSSFVDKITSGIPESSRPKIIVHCDAGDPTERIVELAQSKDAELIVIATHGRTGLKRLLLGSVAEKVVREAGCDVLVCREKRADEKK
jgi:nucleotide-binding universal stress UspA family protein